MNQITPKISTIKPCTRPGGHAEDNQGYCHNCGIVLDQALAASGMDSWQFYDPNNPKGYFAAKGDKP